MPGRHRVYEPIHTTLMGNVPVRINTRTHVFEAVLNYRGEEELLTSPTYTELVKLVQKAVEERAAIVWQPVIVVAAQDSIYFTSGIGITVKREYLGVASNGQMRAVDWGVPEGERVAKSSFRPSIGGLDADTFPITSGKIVYHRYTSLLWDACETLNLVMIEFCNALRRSVEIGVEPGGVASVLANSVNELSKCTLTQDAARKRALAG